MNYLAVIVTIVQFLSSHISYLRMSIIYLDIYCFGS